jgi:amino acid transporter
VTETCDQVLGGPPSATSSSNRYPLYVVGVFLALTLSQAGMIMHWRRHRDQPHWRRSLVFNATGAVLSGIVFVIEGVTKFTAGAWVAIVLIAAITVTALRTRRYYVRTVG